MNYFGVLASLLLTGVSFAQTWSNEVAPIFYNKCASCHHDGGIAPFSLMTYGEVSQMVSAINDEVTNEHMPPWPPDNSYQEYSHSRALSAGEKATVLDWISGGAPEGNSSDTPPPPVFNTGSFLGNGDLTVQIPTYMSKAQSGHDDYVCFSIPTNLLQNRFIRAMEIVPGNRAIVHHALIYVDEAGTYATDTTDGNCGGPQNANLIGGYTPGASPLVFPSGSGFKLGMEIPAGSNIVLAMHYPDGSYGMYDSTKVIFHFYPQGESGIRQVFAASILQNWTLSLPPNEVTTVNAHYPPVGTLPADFSVLSVFPHMHLLGQTIRAYAVNSQGDTIPYISIPQWDFHWQDFYFFRHVQKTPAGSVIRGQAVYDNTLNNPENPSNPPVHVYAGESTTDEMFLVYFHYMTYQAGDENYDLESMMNVGLYELQQPQQSDWNIYPVPFSQSVHIQMDALIPGDRVSLYVYDLQGKLQRILCESETIAPGFAGFNWDGTTNDGTPAAKGTYILSMNRNGSFTSARVIRH